jgi:hypothetical protein
MRSLCNPPLIVHNLPSVSSFQSKGESFSLLLPSQSPSPSPPLPTLATRSLPLSLSLVLTALAMDTTAVQLTASF